MKYYGWYTYDIHENCPIFKTPTPIVHLRPNFFYPLVLGRPFSNEPPPFLMITNQFKQNIIQGRLLCVTRSFLQVGFCFQYHLINLVWLFFDVFLFSWSFTTCFFVALYSCVYSCTKISRNSPSHTGLIILIRFITLKNSWMNQCLKTEEKCNESLINEFKIMRKSDSLHRIMRASN